MGGKRKGRSRGGGGADSLFSVVVFEKQQKTTVIGSGNLQAFLLASYKGIDVTVFHLVNERRDVSS